MLFERVWPYRTVDKMGSGIAACNEYMVKNDRKSFGRTVNICNENIHHYLILNYLRVLIIAFITKTFAIMKTDRGSNERL